jgi:hypothetical protein
MSIVTEKTKLYCPVNSNNRCVGHLCSVWRWKEPHYDTYTLSYNENFFDVILSFLLIFTFNRKWKYLHKNKVWKRLEKKFRKDFESYKNDGWIMSDKYVNAFEGYCFVIRKETSIAKRKAICGLGGDIEFT